MSLHFKHLVLLMGTNPLPNYVVAKYFIDRTPELEKIWLVCSRENQAVKQTGTMEYAKNLEKILEKVAPEHVRKNDSLFPCQKLEVGDASNADSIERKMREQLLNQIRDSGSFHLNYTGGTKSMSAHAYRILTDAMNKYGLDGSVSYLDARNFRLVSDCPKYEEVEKDMRTKVGIAFADLVDLHGFERANKDDDIDFSGAVEAFSRLIENDGLDLFYDADGCWNRELFLDGKGNLAEKTDKLKEENKKYLEEQFVPNDALFSVASALPAEYRLFGADRKFNRDIGKKFKKAVKFLDGMWLEDYAAGIFDKEFGGQGVEILQNWEIRKKGWKTKFELDILLVNGYELTGVSCTTASIKHICKGKGFEILHRTRQIGGGEAKSILVSCLSKGLKATQQELEQDTGGKENILLIGRNGLKKDKLIKTVNDFLQ